MSHTHMRATNSYVPRTHISTETLTKAKAVLEAKQICHTLICVPRTHYATRTHTFTETLTRAKAVLEAKRATLGEVGFGGGPPSSYTV